MKKHLITLIIPMALCAEEPAVDKSAYNLFNPTPAAQMREMSTDRPDQTESAYTVDAGHFQLELDVVGLTYDRRNNDRTTVREWSVMPFNFKVGLNNRSDLQLMFDPYIHSDVKD